MLFPADDLDVFYDAFGVQAIHRPRAGGAPTPVLVVRSQPGVEILGGGVIATEDKIRYRTTGPSAISIAMGDKLTIGNDEYTAREAGKSIRHGLEATVPLAKL